MISPQFQTISGSFPIKQSSDDIEAVIVIPQNYNKIGAANQNMMIFDHNNLNRAFVKISNVKFPEYDENTSFVNPRNYISFYNEFLKLGNKLGLSDAGNFIDYKKFGELYPILCFDVSAHKEYLNVNSLDIVFQYSLSQNPAQALIFHCILIEKRKEF